MPWYTNHKTGKPFFVNGKSAVSRSDLDTRVKIKPVMRRSKTLLRTKQVIKPKSIWDKNWKYTLLKRNSTSFEIIHKKNLAYYIQVKEYRKPIFSIPLKPLVIRGVSGLLQMNGIPVDSEVLTEAVDKAITLHNNLSK